MQKGCRVACSRAGIGIAADANHTGPQGLHTSLHCQQIVVFWCLLSSVKPVMFWLSADLEVLLEGAQGSGRYPDIVQIPKQGE